MKQIQLRELEPAMNDSYSEKELYKVIGDIVFSSGKMMDVGLLRETLRNLDDREGEDVAPNAMFVWQRIRSAILDGKKASRSINRRVLILTVILVLIAAVAVAGALLTHREIMEQVAVPMAQQNDEESPVMQVSYSAEELEELIRVMNENGITLEENNAIVRAMKTGAGYFEEETIMEICRKAFGGNLGTWTLEEQDWFKRMMAEIGFYDHYESFLPGQNNMTYEQAEAFAFEKIKQYDPDVDPENREKWQLERVFYEDQDWEAVMWQFSLLPRDVYLGTYRIQFTDQDPVGTYTIQSNLPDWTGNYSAQELYNVFRNVYSWDEGSWPQQAMRQFHEMLQKAEQDAIGTDKLMIKGIMMTEYPEEQDGEISRDEAIRSAMDRYGQDKVGLRNAVLVECEGQRNWLVGITDASEAEAKQVVLTLDPITGEVTDKRFMSQSDMPSFFFVPRTAYEKSMEGEVLKEEAVQLAAEVVRKTHPGVDLLDENEFSVYANYYKGWTINFRSRNIHHGNVNVKVSDDRKVTITNVDLSEVDGDNLMNRYGWVYGYYGEWPQDVWVQLSRDMAEMQPETLEGKLIALGHYPEESSVPVSREDAQRLAVQAVGTKNVEINTCVLIGAEPHPIWKLRILKYEDMDPVVEIDAVTGEVVTIDQFKVDYTPNYVMYSPEKVWRTMEMEELGPVHIAKVEATYRYADMSLDEPELSLDNTEDWKIEVDGSKVFFRGRWKGMKSYFVELDEKGYVVRCEETETDSMEEKTMEVKSNTVEFTEIPRPTDQPDGKPWFMGSSVAPESYWKKVQETMDHYGITTANFYEKYRAWFESVSKGYQLEPDQYVIASLMNLRESRDLENYAKYGHPSFPTEGKLTLEQCRALAIKAFHEVADPEVGADWVNELYESASFWSDYWVYDKQKLCGCPVWFVQFCVQESWGGLNPKGYVILNEEGEVLEAQLEMEGNG